MIPCLKILAKFFFFHIVPRDSKWNISFTLSYIEAPLTIEFERKILEAYHKSFFTVNMFSFFVGPYPPLILH